MEGIKPFPDEVRLTEIDLVSAGMAYLVERRPEYFKVR